MTLDELEKCLSIVLKRARDMGITEIGPHESDGYWTVTSPDWRDVYSDPEPAVGSLSDDESMLSKLIDDPRRASSVDADRISHLLRALSDKLAY